MSVPGADTCSETDFSFFHNRLTSCLTETHPPPVSELLNSSKNNDPCGYVLRETFEANRPWILFTYTVMLSEFALFALMPYLLGRAVDGLLAGKHSDFHLYAALSVTGLLVGVFRRRMDTRVFIGIWKNQAVESIKGMRSRGVEGTKIISRYRLVGTFAEFFESTLPTAIGAVVDLAIALLMLFLALELCGLVVLGCVAVAMVTYYLSAKRILLIERSLQSLNEETDEKILGDQEGVEQEFEGMRKAWVRRSDIEALSWGLNDILWVLCEIFVVYHLLSDTSSVGMVMATVVYVDRLFSRTSVLAEYFNHQQEIRMVKEVLGDK